MDWWCIRWLLKWGLGNISFSLTKCWGLDLDILSSLPRCLGCLGILFFLWFFFLLKAEIDLLMVCFPLFFLFLLKQQSTSESKPSEAGQLFDPHLKPSWHSLWESQFPSFSEQVLQLQNPISPLLVVSQLTKERVLENWISYLK